MENPYWGGKHAGDIVIGDEAHLRQAAPQLAAIRALDSNAFWSWSW
jgi:hypothetical protein